MYLLQAHVMPHPPLIVPAVGNGREKEINATVQACGQVAEQIAQAKPELIIFISPHGAVYQDYIHISPGDGAQGDLSRFGAFDSTFNLTYDVEFIRQVEQLADRASIPAGGKENTSLDHGVTVPMHFINQHWNKYNAVCVSISGLPPEMHYHFGRCLAQAINGMKRKTVILASGDLSHKLTPDGPYGYTPEGPAFDKQLCDALKQGDFLPLMQLDPDFTEKAAECGLRSIIMMAGALDGQKVSPQLRSYEGPFGVGYGVFSFLPESRYVRLARETLAHYVKTNRMPPLSDDLPPDMLSQKAGTFVSIKKDGELRGCIGTIEPYRANIAEEIRGNAISAGTQDPRFPPITPDELDDMVISVDILSPSERIDSPTDLDVQRYGVIVTCGSKKGLLLPNLETVDTVEQQIAIALQKAGIALTEDYQLARFEVVRHT